MTPPPAAYFVIISTSKTPRFVKWMINTDNSYNILKSVTDSANLILSPRKCSNNYVELTKSMEQIVRSLSLLNSTITMPTHLQEVCKIIDDLIQADVVNKNLMGDNMKSRLAEIQQEKAALKESGLRPTPARCGNYNANLERIIGINILK